MIAWAQRNAQNIIFTGALLGIGIGAGQCFGWGAGVLASCSIVVGLMVLSRVRG